MLALFRDARFGSGFGFLSDRRHLQSPFDRMGLERVLQFFATHPEELTGSSWAVVTSGPGPVHDSTSIVAKLSAPSGIYLRPFTAFDPAIEWVAPGTDPAHRRAYLEWLDANAIT
jgi:hypothetical protein